jgi:fatty-acyl-CoA synthase
MTPPSVIEAISLNARRHPQKLALVDESGAITYGDLHKRSNAIACALARNGLRKGDRAIIAVGNRCEHIEALLAIATLGAIPVPIDVLSRTEFGRMCEAIDPAAIVAEQRFVEGLEAAEAAHLTSRPSIIVGAHGNYEDLIAAHSGQAPDAPAPQANEPLLFMVTSGTTGAPKCCSVSQGAYAMRCILKNVEDSVRATDTHLSILPICFNAGRGAALAHLYLGATTVLLPEFDPDKVAHLIRTKQITTLMVVPRICARLLESAAPPEAYASLRRVNCTGAAMPIEVKRQFTQSICPELYNSYGSTDTGPVAALAPHDLIVKHGSAGQLSWGVDVVAMDDAGRMLPDGEEGELACRSPYLIDGYFGMSAPAALPSGWLLTGDVGCLDGDGYLYLRSRRKEIIKSGGTTIYPTEIEDALRLHAGVSDASVFGIANMQWGEAVVAAVVVKPSQHVLPEELISFCKTRLAPYKAPKQIIFVAKLPYTTMGKVNKRELASLFDAGAANPANA